MTEPKSRPFKFGRVDPSDRSHEAVEHRYGDRWDVQKTSGSDRIVAAPAAGHVSLVKALVEELPEPFGLLYVLIASRGEHEDARYQCPSPLDRSEVHAFLEQYEEFLERDGRHHVWLTSLPASSTLVYDNHDLVYAYGPLERFQRVLEERGLERGEVRVPVPHAHHYHAEYDAAADELMGRWTWIASPLRADDE